jgi:hypothetical protein
MTAATSLQSPATPADPAEPQAAGARASLRDLARVLVRPLSTLRLERTGGDTARLILLVIAIDLLISLLLVPTLMQELRANWATIPGVSVGTKVTALGVGIIAGMVINTLLIVVVGSLSAMLLFLVDRRPSFADLIGTLIVATVPLMLDRFVRACVYYVSVDSPAWREMASIGGLTGLAAKGTLGEIAHFFTIFDAWSAVLIVIALRRVSRLNFAAAAVLMALSWGPLQYLLFQLHAAGYMK